MSHYILLLHDDPATWQKLSPQEMQETTEKYMAWSKKPFTTGGKRLTPEPGRVMRAKAGQVQATDGPYSETKEMLGGFYTIEAANYDEAVERTRDHPHLQFGTIEIRHIYGT